MSNVYGLLIFPVEAGVPTIDPNQYLRITDLLEAGVRGFLIDTYPCFDNPAGTGLKFSHTPRGNEPCDPNTNPCTGDDVLLCHTSGDDCVGNFQSNGCSIRLTRALREIREFLERNQGEIIYLDLEDKTQRKNFGDLLNQAIKDELGSFVYTFSEDPQQLPNLAVLRNSSTFGQSRWPTPAEMLRLGKQVLILGKDTRLNEGGGLGKMSLPDPTGKVGWIWPGQAKDRAGCFSQNFASDNCYQFGTIDPHQGLANHQFRGESHYYCWGEDSSSPPSLISPAHLDRPDLWRSSLWGAPPGFIGGRFDTSRSWTSITWSREDRTGSTCSFSKEGCSLLVATREFNELGNAHRRPIRMPVLCGVSFLHLDMILAEDATPFISTGKLGADCEPECRENADKNFGGQNNRLVQSVWSWRQGEGWPQKPVIGTMGLLGFPYDAAAFKGSDARWTSEFKTQLLGEAETFVEVEIEKRYACALPRESVSAEPLTWPDKAGVVWAVTEKKGPWKDGPDACRAEFGVKGTRRRELIERLYLWFDERSPADSPTGETFCWKFGHPDKSFFQVLTPPPACATDNQGFNLRQGFFGDLASSGERCVQDCAPPLTGAGEQNANFLANSVSDRGPKYDGVDGVTIPADMTKRVGAPGWFNRHGLVFAVPKNGWQNRRLWEAWVWECGRAGLTREQCAQTEDVWLGYHLVGDRWVTVPDQGNRPPVALCQDVTVPTGPGVCSAAVASVDAGSSDPDGDPISLVQVPAGPYQGASPLTLTVADDSGGESSCTATVTVADREPPKIVCPSAQRLECTGPGGASLPLTPEATDNCAVSLRSCDAGPFPIGTTTASCQATDTSRNSGACSTSVQVVDTTAPQISCPAPRVAECTSPAGAVVQLAATAMDVCDSAPAATCPDSGKTFALGTTAVACQARDAAGNASGCGSSVQVVDTTAPAVSCIESVNPSGANVPPAKNEDGFYRIGVSDVCASAPTVRLGDFSLVNGETIKITQTAGLAGVRLVNTMGPLRIRHFQVGPGDAVIVGSDGINTTRVVCAVPPPPM